MNDDLCDPAYMWATEAILLLGDNGQRRLIQAHVEGKLSLTGRLRVQGHPLELGDRVQIPKAYFADNVTFEADYSVGADGAVTDFAEFERNQGLRRWEEVRVAREDVHNLGVSKSAPLTHTGAAGRPNSSHLVEAEFHRRVSSGEVSSTLAEEARQLSAWLTRTHQFVAPITEKTIRNRLRGVYLDWRMKAQN